jgi:hypothetical protein
MFRSCLLLIIIIIVTKFNSYYFKKYTTCDEALITKVLVINNIKKEIKI